MAKRFNYVYRVELESTGEYYIGVRSCDCRPEKDSYKGSMVAWKVDKKLLTKTIIGLYETRAEANLAESILIKGNVSNRYNRNGKNHSSKVDWDYIEDCERYKITLENLFN